MKTTIDIPEGELKDAMRFTGASTKKDAVVRVLKDFNRRQRMAGLVKYSGTFTHLDTNEEIEQRDANRMKGVLGENFRVSSSAPEGVQK